MSFPNNNRDDKKSHELVSQLFNLTQRPPNTCDYNPKTNTLFCWDKRGPFFTAIPAPAPAPTTKDGKSGVSVYMPKNRCNQDDRKMIKAFIENAAENIYHRGDYTVVDRTQQRQENTNTRQGGIVYYIEPCLPEGTTHSTFKK